MHCALARQKIVNITDVTKFPALQIQYVGSKAYSKITVAAGGDITIHADDTDGATDVYATFDLSTPAAGLDTFGELADAINAYADLRCFLIGALPSQGTDDKLDTLSATSIRTNNGLTLYFDEAKSGNLDVGFAITNQKFTNRQTGGFSTKQKGWTKDKYCVNSLNYLYAAVTAAGVGNIEVYAIDDSNGSVVNIWNNAIADATSGVTEEHGTTDHPDAPFLKAPQGHRIVVWLDMAAAITAIDLLVHGYTESILDAEVPGDNYTGCV